MTYQMTLNDHVFSILKTLSTTRFKTELDFNSDYDNNAQVKMNVKLRSSDISIVSLSITVFSNNQVIVSGSQYKGTVNLSDASNDSTATIVNNVFNNFHDKIKKIIIHDSSK